MQGTIHRLIRGKGFGFIQAEGRQFFFHHSEVREIAFKQLTLGDVVEFQGREEEEGKNPRAVEITVVEKKDPPPRRQQPVEAQPARQDSGRRKSQPGAKEKGRAGSSGGGRGRRRPGPGRERIASREGTSRDGTSSGGSREVEFAPLPSQGAPRGSPRGDEWEAARRGGGEPGDDEWQPSRASGPVDEETFNQFNSKERAPPGDPFEAYSGDYFGVGVENGRREERARPAGEEIGLEDADDGEFIEALPDAAGQDQRPRDGRRERQAGTSDRRRGRDGNRGGTKSRRKGGREKPRRPKASGPPGERGEGVIRALNSERGFGFIETPTGDIFFHKSGVREDFTLLSIGARVAFVFGQGDNGIKAEDVAVLG